MEALTFPNAGDMYAECREKVRRDVDRHPIVGRLTLRTYRT